MSPVNSLLSLCHISGETRLKAMGTQTSELEVEAVEKVAWSHESHGQPDGCAP